MSRDFTYIDDIVESMVRLIPKPPEVNSANEDPAPAQLFNIGNGSPVNLLELLRFWKKSLE